jgi:hypothetical protein
MYTFAQFIQEKNSHKEKEKQIQLYVEVAMYYDTKEQDKADDEAIQVIIIDIM